MSSQNLSPREQEALLILRRELSILVTHIPDKNETDHLGTRKPGMPVYRKLIKKGYCIQTEEEPTEDGFIFTESIELTEEGEKVAESIDFC